MITNTTMRPMNITAKGLNPFAFDFSTDSDIFNEFKNFKIKYDLKLSWSDNHGA